MKGRIIKGVAGEYEVYVEEKDRIYRCRAKGIFRKKGVKPLVGDQVLVEEIGENEGNITEILPRKNELIRPQVSNVDACLVVFAWKNPDVSLGLLDRYLIQMAQQNIPTILCLNKSDLVSAEEQKEFMRIYRDFGGKLISISCENGWNMDRILDEIRGKTVVLAGPSGVGKSSLLNRLYPEAESKTGAISEKLKRGKHTTRHSEIFALGDHTYVLDTPGFGDAKILPLSKEELKNYYPEFHPYEGMCRFSPCTHTHEPGCKIKEMVKDQGISKERYDSYLLMYEEQKELEKRKYR